VTGSTSGERAAELRTAFDACFAAPFRGSAPETVALLLVRVGPHDYAIRVSDLSGLVSGRKIAPLPSGRSELLGLAGIRGSVVAVYGLAAVLGHPPQVLDSPWLALAGAPEPVGFAFDALQGFLRVEAGLIHGADPAEPIRGHVREVVRVGAATRRVIDVRGAVLALEQRAGEPGTAKER